MAARLEGRTPFHTPRGGPSPETGQAAREDRPQAKGSKTGGGSADHCSAGGKSRSCVTLPLGSWPNKH